MGIQVIPIEVLSHIFGFLLAPEDELNELHYGQAVDLEDLRNARRVCRTWNDIASLHMFRTIALLHSKLGFRNFRKMTASPMVQDAARCVDIYSGPHHYRHSLLEHREYWTWRKWEDAGKYKAFTSAIDCIAELLKLQAVHIRFSDMCHHDTEFCRLEGSEYEVRGSRKHTLEAVFKAIRTRAARENSTTIRSLTIQNLQNLPLPKFVASDLFKAVANDIIELRLLVAHEYNEDKTDEYKDYTSEDDLCCEERRTFEPWLQK